MKFPKRYFWLRMGSFYVAASDLVGGSLDSRLTFMITSLLVTLVVLVEQSVGCVSLSVWLPGQWLLNEIIFDLDIWYAGSAWPYLGHVWSTGIFRISFSCGCKFYPVIAVMSNELQCMAILWDINSFIPSWIRPGSKAKAVVPCQNTIILKNFSVLF